MVSQDVIWIWFLSWETITDNKGTEGSKELQEQSANLGFFTLPNYPWKNEGGTKTFSDQTRENFS